MNSLARWPLPFSLLVLFACGTSGEMPDETGAAASGAASTGVMMAGDPCNDRPAPNPPRLHVEGRHFKDANGNTVVLRGAAIADVREVNTDRPGMSVTQMMELLSDPEDGFHARVVRLTVYPERWLPDPDVYLEQHLRPAVEHASQLGLYVIIDWHEISDVAAVSDRTLTFWQKIAPEFGQFGHVLFELFNEPMDVDNPDWSTWKQAAQPWVDAIREEAPETIILIGGPFWSQQIGGAATDPFVGQNLAYVGHIYPIIDPAAWSEDGVFAQVAAEHPLMITEWGFRNDGGEIWDATATSFGAPLKAFIESHNLSWTAWCADNVWAPVMFDADWTLLRGEGEMGGFVKDWLTERRNQDQPGGPRHCGSSSGTGG